MRKHTVILGGAVVLLVVALCLGSLSANRASEDADKGNLLSAAPQVQATPVPPSGQITLTASASANQVLWFVPQDLSTSATVLIIDNTNSTEVLVRLTIYDIAGGKINEWVVEIGAGDQGRFCSDFIAATEGPWLLGQVLNFGTAAARGLLEVPSGVLVDGYIVWNGVSNTFDPGAAVPVLPLRFVNPFAQ